MTDAHPPTRPHPSAVAAAPRPLAPSPVVRRADSVARGGVVALVGQITNALGGFALLVMAGHWLGAAQTGVVFSATAAFTVLFNTAKLGGDTAMIRFASGLTVTRREGALRALLNTALGPAAITSCVIALVGVVFSSTWARLLYADVPVSEGKKYIILGSLFLPAASISLVLLAFARGLGRVAPVVTTDQIFKPLVRPALLALVILMGGGALAFYVSWLIPVAVGLVFAIFVVRGALRGVPRGGARPIDGRQFWSFAAPRAVGGILDICAPWIGVIILSGAVSSTSAASFTAVTRLVMVGTIVMLALRTATSAHVGGAFARGDRHMIEGLQFTTTAWMVLTSWPFFFIAMAFPNAMLGIFGGNFKEGAVALIVVAASNLVNLGTGNAQITVLMSGHSLWNLTGAAVALTTQVVLAVLLVHNYGVTGAGWALGASVVAENLVAYWQVRRGLRLRLWNSAVFVAAGAATVASAVGILIGRLISTGLLGVFIAGAIAAVILLVAALRFRRLLFTREFTTAFGHHDVRPSEATTGATAQPASGSPASSPATVSTSAPPTVPITNGARPAESRTYASDDPATVGQPHVVGGRPVRARVAQPGSAVGRWPAFRRPGRRRP